MTSVSICARNSQLKKSRGGKVENYYNVLQFAFHHFFIMFKWQTNSLTCSQVLSSTQMISMLHLEKNSLVPIHMNVAHKRSLTQVDSCLNRCTEDCAPSVEKKQNKTRGISKDHAMCQKLNEEVLKGKKNLHQLSLNLLIIQADCSNGEQNCWS